MPHRSRLPSGRPSTEYPARIAALRPNAARSPTQKYVRALEARGIEHVLVGSKSFHRREEIGSARAALRAIEWPDDELSVYAVLRGALFFIPDSDLFKFREQHGRFHTFLHSSRRSINAARAHIGLAFHPGGVGAVRPPVISTGLAQHRSVPSSDEVGCRRQSSQRRSGQKPISTPTKVRKVRNRSPSKGA